MNEQTESEAIALADKQYREYRQAFWDYMAKEHNMHLLASQQDDIERLILGPRNNERDVLIVELNKLYRQNAAMRTRLVELLEVCELPFDVRVKAK